MKKSKYPRLRSKTFKGASGQVWTYYIYDMRGTGEKDVRLGTDYASAVEQWHRLNNHIPLTVGRIQQAIDKWRAEILPTYTVPNTRAQYKSYLLNVESAFGQMAWHEVRLPTLMQYLDARSAKTSANREMAVFALVWKKAKFWEMTDLLWPAAGLAGFVVSGGFINQFSNPLRATSLSSFVFLLLRHPYLQDWAFSLSFEAFPALPTIIWRALWLGRHSTHTTSIARV